MMSKTMQLFQFFLLCVALFVPYSKCQPQGHLDNDDNDECHLKTSIVLSKLADVVNDNEKKCEDNFKRTKLWTDVVEKMEGTLELVKTQVQENANLIKVEKIEGTLELAKTQTQENAHLIKMEKMERTLELMKTEVEDITKFINSMKNIIRTYFAGFKHLLP